MFTPPRISFNHETISLQGKDDIRDIILTFLSNPSYSMPPYSDLLKQKITHLLSVKGQKAISDAISNIADFFENVISELIVREVNEEKGKFFVGLQECFLRIVHNENNPTKSVPAATTLFIRRNVAPMKQFIMPILNETAPSLLELSTQLNSHNTLDEMLNYLLGIIPSETGKITITGSRYSSPAQPSLQVWQLIRQIIISLSQEYSLEFDAARDILNPREQRQIRAILITLNTPCAARS